MNLKKYTLKEHIEYAKDSYYMDHRIDISCTVPEQNYINTKTKNSVINDVKVNDVCTIRNSVQLRNGGLYTISMKDLWYENTYGNETIEVPNITFTTSNDGVINKQYQLGNTKLHYMVVGVKTIVFCSSNTYTSKITYHSSKIIKQYSINDKSIVEETTSTGKLTKSVFYGQNIKIRMSKMVSHSEGTGFVEFNNTKVVFNFEGEPSFLRFLSNNFVFNMLVSTELGSIIEELRSIILELINELCPVIPSKPNVSKVIEYYTNED